MAAHKTEADRLVVIDEFEKDEIFCFGHLVLNPRQADMAVRRWTKLQIEIKARLLARGGPIHPKLSGDQLPEIHAEWLVQSGKYYRWPEAKNKDYWREHLDWLQESMRIIRHAAPAIHYGSKIDHRKDMIEKLKQANIYRNETLISEIGTSTYEKYISIMCNPHVDSLCITLATLERMFFSQGLSYEVICDNYDQCKGFSMLKVFQELHTHKITASAVVPQFLSSEEEQLIQMADVATYAGGQIIWANRRLTTDPKFRLTEKIERVIKDHQKFLFPLDGEYGTSPPPRGKQIDALSRPIFYDMMLNYVGGPEDLRKELLNTKEAHIQALLDSDLN